MYKTFKILGGIAVVTLSIVSYTLAYTQEQIDAYQRAYKYGITTQSTIDDAKMNSTLTRQAFAKMVVNYLENVVGVKKNMDYSCHFPDEGKITSGLLSYTKKACAYKIMGSNGNNFNPTHPVDRAQLGTVISRILWGDKYNNKGQWYYINHLNKLREVGIMNKIDNPSVHAKRGDVMIMMKRLYEKFGSNISIIGGEISLNSLNNTSINVPIVRKTDANGFSYYDSYLDNPRLSNAMKNMKLRSTSCENIFCQQVADDGTYKNQKHYYWDNKEGAMILLTGVYFISDCTYYDNVYESSKNFLSDNNNHSSNYDYYENDDYLSIFYEKKVIYTGEDGTKYYYDTDFLEMLNELADKKGESNLSEYLKIQIAFLKDVENFEELLDDEELEKATGVTMEDDFQNWSQEEKDKALTKAKNYLNSIEEEFKGNSNKYIKDLNNVVKSIKDDKFSLKDNYKNTEEYIKSYTSMLSLYFSSFGSILDSQIQLEEKQNDEEIMATMFGLLGISMNLEGFENKYKNYQETWAVKTLNLLGKKVATNNNWKSTGSNSGQTISDYEAKARDIDRKVALSQLQSAIVTSQLDTGKWPGMDKGATKGISVSTIEKELIAAGMSRIPSDPKGNNEVSGLGSTNVVDGGYSYIVTKRNGTNNAGFVLMSKMELTSTSNWVVCKNKSGLDNGYITNDTELVSVKPCKELIKGNLCSAKSCTYSDDDELRYIVIY